MSDEPANDDPDFEDEFLGKPGELAVSIRDLSGANGSDPVETIRGFTGLAHANAFARRYVRDSLERCRARGMTAEQVLSTWFNFGEDAIIEDAPDSTPEGAWNSGTEIRDFAAAPLTDREERNWRALDPRRIAEAEAEEEDDDEGEDEA
jgi:hypothetical protein